MHSLGGNAPPAASRSNGRGPFSDALLGIFSEPIDNLFRSFPDSVAQSSTYAPQQFSSPLFQTCANSPTEVLQDIRPLYSMAREQQRSTATGYPSSVLRWLQRKRYQYEVTFSLYMLTPTEKFVLSTSMALSMLPLSRIASPIHQTVSSRASGDEQKADIVYRFNPLPCRLALHDWTLGLPPRTRMHHVPTHCLLYLWCPSLVTR